MIHRTKLYILSSLLLLSGILSAQCPGSLTLVNTTDPVTGSPTPRSLAYSPDGNYLTAVYSTTDLVTTFAVDQTSGTLLAPVTIVGDRADYVEYSPNGKFLVTVSSTLNSLSIYSVNTITGALTLVTTFGGPGETSSPNSASFSPDSQFLSVSNQTSPTGAISVYSIDQTTGTPTFVGNFSGSPILSMPISVDYSPDGNFLAAAYAGSNMIRVFSVNSSTGALTQVPGSDVATTGQPSILLYSPDGNSAAVGNSDIQFVDIYSVNPATGIFTHIQNFTPFAAPANYSLSYSPNGEFLATASPAAVNIRVFAIDQNTGLATFADILMRGSFASSIVYAPNGEFVAITNDDFDSISAYTTTTVYEATFEASPSTICTGESSTLAVAITGGTEPYTVTWADIGAQSGNSPITRTVSPTTTTTYSITSIADANGCVLATIPADVTVTVDQAPMTVTLSGSSTICQGGTTGLSLSITGGASPYTVIWSDGAISSGIGPVFSRTISGITRTTTYSAVVTDANGCAAVTSNSVTVTVNNLPNWFITNAPTTICRGSSSTLTMDINGVNPFTVVWSDGFTQTGVTSPVTRTVSPLSTTTYSATVTDSNGCTSSNLNAVTVTIRALPTGIIVRSPTAICAGDSATVTVEPIGTSPLTIIWSDGVVSSGVASGTTVPRTVSPLSTTTYSAQIIDNIGCKASTIGTVLTVRDLPAVSLAAPCASITAGQSTDLVLVAEGAGPFDVAWSDGFMQTNVPSPITHTVSPAVTTSYFATVTDVNNCQETSNTVAVMVTP